MARINGHHQQDAADLAGQGSVPKAGFSPSTSTPVTPQSAVADPGPPPETLLAVTAEARGADAAAAQLPEAPSSVPVESQAAEVCRGDLVTIRQAHEITGISERTLWRLMREGRLTAFGSRRSYRISLEKVLLLARSQKGRERKRLVPLWPEVRERQIATLESVFQREFDEAEPEWRLLLEELGLALWYYSAARLAIDEAKWRHTTDPYAYVAAVTRREAEGLGLANYEARELKLNPGGEISAEETMDYLGQDLSKNEKGVWHSRTQAGDDYGDAYDRVDERWLHPDADPGMEVDWDAVAQSAGLDELEAEVLKLRSGGIRRELLFGTSQSDEERMEWQAAWRRLSGKIGVVEAALRGRLEKRSHKELPESP